MPRSKRKAKQAPKAQVPESAPDLVLEDIRLSREAEISNDAAHKPPLVRAVMQPSRDGMFSFSKTASASNDISTLRTPTQTPESSKLGLQDHGHMDPFQSPSNPPKNKKIMYRLHCSDNNSGTSILRYAWSPFKGLHENHAEKEERKNLAVLDIMDRITGEHMVDPPRKHQHRRNFWETDPEDFVIGEHFRSSNHNPTCMRIHSRYILKVFQGLIHYYPGFSFSIDSVVESGVHISEPYKEIFHYWDSLQQILQESRGKSEGEIIVKKPLGTESSPDVRISCQPLTYDHLETLLTSEAIREIWEDIVKPERERNERGVTAFNSMWLLYKPGSIVYAKGVQSSNKVAGYIVMSIKYFSENNTMPELFPDPADYWRLQLWNLSYDNGRLRRRTFTVKIFRFNEDKAISELPAVPTKYAADQENIRDNMIKRGQRYYHIISHDLCHMRYNGLVVSDKPYFYRGEIIVDHKGFKHANGIESSYDDFKEGGEPDDFRGGPYFSKFNDMECSVGTELEPDQYLLLPGIVQGFALEKRERATFDMDFVTDIVFEEYPMRHLIIDADKQDLIQAVAGRVRDGVALKAWTVDWDADFVEGKGRGRVVFLHGPPGTGKTLTVELIAKKTHRPLVRLSVADLGTREVEMEMRLTEWLDRAANWGAIVLIDEAEIYLEQRKSGDISRNALVSAFLRTLEYFPGLLFLTSNGIGLIDEAVMSRIHLAVGYKRPDDNQRKRIWRELFDKLEDDQRNEGQLLPQRATGSKGGDADKSTAKPSIVVTSTARDVVNEKSYVSMALNGRDIRNLLLSAISLARDDSYAPGAAAPKEIKVTANHLEKVMKNKQQFHADYKLATGFSPDAIAAEQFRRGETVTDTSSVS